MPMSRVRADMAVPPGRTAAVAVCVAAAVLLPAMGPSLSARDPGSVRAMSPPGHRTQIQSLRRKVTYSTSDRTIISAVEA
jgi:hypothetical protein